MGRTVVICGQVRGHKLLQVAIHQFLVAKKQGLISRIILSTWAPDLPPSGDLYAAIAAQGVEILLTPPIEKYKILGNIFEQILLFDVALDIIPEEDFVLRSRTDLLFIDDAISNLVNLDLSIPLDRRLPNVFTHRIWVMQCYLTTPFYVADFAYYGKRNDLRQLSNYDFYYEVRGVDCPVQEYWKSSSGAAAEVRRALNPFLTAFPIFQEFRDVWPKACIGKEIGGTVTNYNLASPVFQEYLALYFKIMHHYFRVGGIEKFGKKIFLAQEKEGVLGVRMFPIGANAADAIDMDKFTENFRLFRYPIHTNEGVKDSSLHPVFCEDHLWLDRIFSGWFNDPNVEAFILAPLERALVHRHTLERIQAFLAYKKGLYALAEQPVQSSGERAPE